MVGGVGCCVVVVGGATTSDNCDSKKVLVIMMVMDTSITAIEADYIDRLRLMQSSDDPERDHLHADSVLCSMLTQLGYAKVVEEYKKVIRWYS